MADTVRPFDRSRLTLSPLSERIHDLDLGVLLPLAPGGLAADAFEPVAEAMVRARESGASIILMIGAHVLRAGVQRYLIDWMERGYLSCLAMNGAGVIHDYELALIGATTESVARYIRDGRFGLWQELGRLNEIASEAARTGRGLGEAAGRAIEEGDFPHKDLSVLAAAYRLGIPATVHVGIGYDIVFELPNCDGAAYGAASYTDFLRFAAVLEGVSGGVLMNFGSAVMGPEVFLKALSMVRNAARQDGREVSGFSTLVCDLADLPSAYREEPDKADPRYYFRPWKTMLVRTVADATSYFVRGPHRETIPGLWTALGAAEGAARGGGT